MLKAAPGPSGKPEEETADLFLISSTDLDYRIFHSSISRPIPE
jgi:hypothetical protein